VSAGRKWKKGNLRGLGKKGLVTFIEVVHLREKDKGIQVDCPFHEFNPKSEDGMCETSWLLIILTNLAKSRNHMRISKTQGSDRGRHT
jgi:hypothetical protein